MILRFTKYAFTVLAVMALLATWALAQETRRGFDDAIDCGWLTNPVTQGIICLQTTTTGTRTKGHLYTWNGTAWTEYFLGSPTTIPAAFTGAAIQASIDALPAAGGIIQLLVGEYVLTTALNPGAKPVIIQGAGWTTLVGASFGDAQWLAAGAVKGSVLKVTSSTVDGIAINNPTYRELILRDLAVLGPGSGATSGINAGLGAQNNRLKWSNVLIANFATCLRLFSSLDNSFYNLYVSGCTTGIHFVHGSGGLTNMRFYDFISQNNATGILLASGNLISFYGGLVQSNTTGIDIAPGDAVTIDNIAIDGMWFEGNTSPYRINTTNAAISNLSFRNIRNAETYTLNPTLVNLLNGVSFENSRLGGITLNFSNALNRNVYLRNINPAGLTLPTGDQEVTRINVNNVTSFASVEKTITFAATISPSYADGEVQQVTLTGNIDINSPSSAPSGATMTFIIRQDGTGGRTVTWGAVSGGYHVLWSDTGNTANKYSTIKFYHVGGGQWIQVGAQSPYVS